MQFAVKLIIFAFRHILILVLYNKQFRDGSGFYIKTSSEPLITITIFND